MNWSCIRENEEIEWREFWVRGVLAVLLVFLAFTSLQSQEAQERPRVVDVLRREVNYLATHEHEIWLPFGTPDDAACRAFWRLSSYQSYKKRYEESKVKDSPFLKFLEGHITDAAKQTNDLFNAKMEAGEKLGCGGRELPDDFIIGVVRAAMPKRIPPAHLGRQK